MKVFKALLLLLALLSFGSFFKPLPVNSQNNEVNLYFFWSRSCPHCAKEKEFLEKVSLEYSELQVKAFEIGSTENTNILKSIGEKFKIDISGVPVTFIGDGYFVGYRDDATSGETIRELIDKNIREGYPDVLSGIINENNTSPAIDSKPEQQINTPSPQVNKQIVNIPLFEELSLKNLSLPAITIVLAAIDGFNPCAMWTLLFLLSLLLGMKDKRKRWILGFTFIVASALVYFLFMAAWLNLIIFIGFMLWVRILIGAIAIGGGSYNLYSFFNNKDGGCKVTGSENRKRVFDKLKKITQQKIFALSLAGIVLLAFAVNLVELICSAGLPVVFTQILAMHELSRTSYYLYMILYVFVFMLDDLLIFIMAMVTLEITGISTKYARYSHLIGGIIMIAIGILLIIKPEALTLS